MAITEEPRSFGKMSFYYTTRSPPPKKPLGNIYFPEVDYRVKRILRRRSRSHYSPRARERNQSRYLPVHPEDRKQCLKNQCLKCQEVWGSCKHALKNNNTTQCYFCERTLDSNSGRIFFSLTGIGKIACKECGFRILNTMKQDSPIIRKFNSQLLFQQIFA